MAALHCFSYILFPRYEGSQRRNDDLCAMHGNMCLYNCTYQFLHIKLRKKATTTDHGSNVFIRVCGLL